MGMEVMIEVLEKIVKSKEEFSTKKLKLNSNLIYVAFLMFSAYSSYGELSASGQEGKKEKEAEFETFYSAVVNWVFLFCVSLEMAMAAELTKHRDSLITEWERISLVVIRFLGIQAHIANILNLEERTLQLEFEIFETLRNTCLQNAQAVIRELEGFGDRPIPIRSMERRDELLRSFDIASQKLAEVNIMHRKLLEVSRDSELKLLRKLLLIATNLEDTAKAVLDSLQAINDDNSLKDKATTWRDKVNESRSSLEEIHLSSDRTRPDHRHQMDNLLKRFGEIHCPSWYFEFLQVVNKDIEQLQTYKKYFQVYIADVQGLIPEIEQLLFNH
ncbi:hypothetical protein CAEBREN_03702 [Caenorhabditis brenneri]|uniref:Uncharacterized protein n=1 Tax=Caenorhabditis brenneri TaxID=135651 RepID=G0N686_CAEBE|nr:hypothetical protein CAEBREN_03702 [Caenorhabditis brenneri]